MRLAEPWWTGGFVVRSWTALLSATVTSEGVTSTSGADYRLFLLAAARGDSVDQIGAEVGSIRAAFASGLVILSLTLSDAANALGVTAELAAAAVAQHAGVSKADRFVAQITEQAVEASAGGVSERYWELDGPDTARAAACVVTALVRSLIVLVAQARSLDISSVIDIYAEAASGL